MLATDPVYASRYKRRSNSTASGGAAALVVGRVLRPVGARDRRESGPVSMPSLSGVFCDRSLAGGWPRQGSSFYALVVGRVLRRCRRLSGGGRRGGFYALIVGRVLRHKDCRRLPCEAFRVSMPSLSGVFCDWNVPPPKLDWQDRFLCPHCRACSATAWAAPMGCGTGLYLFLCPR